MSELNPNPVITPILDLTLVRSQAAELGNLTNVTPITAAASYGQAALISAQQRTIQEEQVDSAPTGASVVFEQNNYSPESLSEIEIYRQTKNQLSQLKSALAIT
jgi:radical SAM superfamily enzyme with C-terminal helix-hairpin-helix motif